MIAQSRGEGCLIGGWVMAVMAHLFACVWWGTPSNDLCGKSGIRVGWGRCKINHITLFCTSSKPFLVVYCVSSPTRVYTHSLFFSTLCISANNPEDDFSVDFVFKVSKETLAHILVKDIVKVDYRRNWECIFNSVVMVDGANMSRLWKVQPGAHRLYLRGHNLLLNFTLDFTALFFSQFIDKSNTD